MCVDTTGMNFRVLAIVLVLLGPSVEVQAGLSVSEQLRQCCSLASRVFDSSCRLASRTFAKVNSAVDPYGPLPIEVQKTVNAVETGDYRKHLGPDASIDQAIETFANYLSEKQPTLPNELMMRAIDIVAGVVGLGVSTPVVLGAGIAILIEDGHDPRFFQTRLTKDAPNGESVTFEIYKLRSMSIDAESAQNGGAQFARAGDSRVTRVGRMIRATRIDELLQFINMIKGDMSLIGPRPERPVLAEKIMKALPHFKLRTKVKAGVTGISASKFDPIGAPRPGDPLFELVKDEKFYTPLKEVPNGAEHAKLKLLGDLLWMVKLTQSPQNIAILVVKTSAKTADTMLKKVGY